MSSPKVSRSLRLVNSPTMRALLAAMTVAFVILREPLFSPGLIEWSADLKIHRDIVIERSASLTSWNAYVFDSGNTELLSQTLLFFWVYLLPTSESAQRVYMFVVYALTFFSMAMLVHYWGRTRGYGSISREVFALLAGAVYVFNGWVIVEAVHVHLLWTYALVPVLILLTLLMLDGASLPKATLYGAWCGALSMYTATAHGMAMSASLVTGLIALFLLLNIRQRGVLKASLPRCALFLGAAAAAAVLVGAIWLLPYAAVYRQDLAGGQSWILFKPADVRLWSSFTPLEQVLRLHWTFSDTLIARALPAWVPLAPIQIASFIPIIAATLAAVVLRNDTIVKALAILVLIAIFLAKGATPPFDTAYHWLSFQTPLSPLFGWMLRGPYKLYILAAPLMIFLASVFFLELTARVRVRWAPMIRRFRFQGAAVAVALAGLTVANGAPLFTGNLDGYYRPIELPSDYQVLEELPALHNGFYRLAWLPPSYDVQWRDRFPGIALNEELTPLPEWASPRPVMSRGVTYLPPTRARIFDHYVKQTIAEGTLQDAGKLYALANVKYVIFHSDLRDPARFRPMGEGLARQNDLELRYERGSVQIYENLHTAPYVAATPRLSIGVGGLELLGAVAMIDGAEPAKHPILMVEDRIIPRGDLQKSAAFADSVLFYGGKTLDDLVLSTIGSEYVVSVASADELNDPDTRWVADFFHSHLWVPFLMDQRNGVRYDFDLGQRIAYTRSPGAQLELHAPAGEAGDQDLWLRLFFSEIGGELEVTIGDGPRTTISTGRPVTEGFRWVRVGEAIGSGQSVRVDFENVSGFNALNALAVVPRDEYEELSGSYREMMESGRAPATVIAPFWAGVTSSRISVPVAGAYRVAMRSVDGANTQVWLGDQELEFSSSVANSQFVFSSPIELQPGLVELDLADPRARDTVLFLIPADRMEQPGLGLASGGYDFAHANRGPDHTRLDLPVASEQQLIVALGEGYDRFWNASTSSTELQQIPLNGLTNGYLLPPTEETLLRLEYQPERYYRLGRTITVLVTVIAGMLTILYGGLRLYQTWRGS